jgi:hypothetical protein
MPLPVVKDEPPDQVPVRLFGPDGVMLDPEDLAAAIQSKSALGAFGRRLRARMDAPRAIKALAHKLARLIYRMLSAGVAYKDIGEHYYEERYREHLVAKLQKQAAHFDFHLTPQQGK